MCTAVYLYEYLTFRLDNVCVPTQLLSCTTVQELLPRIPVQPVGYEDAEKILRRLGGEPAPAEWQAHKQSIIGRETSKTTFHYAPVYSWRERNGTLLTKCTQRSGIEDCPCWFSTYQINQFLNWIY